MSYVMDKQEKKEPTIYYSEQEVERRILIWDSSNEAPIYEHYGKEGSRIVPRSRPIMCPERIVCSMDEDELREESEECYYDSMTWRMYHRIVRNRSKSHHKKTTNSSRRYSVLCRRDSDEMNKRNSSPSASVIGTDAMETIFVLDL